jgi:hypothetical protein
VVLIVLASLALLLGLGDGVLLVPRLAAADVTGTSFVAGQGDQNGALTALLTRRASAVLKHDERAFLADVDQADPKFAAHQRDEYQNLLALGLSTFTMTLDAPTRYRAGKQGTDLTRRYSGLVREVGVTVRYSISGLDRDPVAEPWVPVFGYSHGHWVLAAEAANAGDSTLPLGTGGLPWEALPITVVRSPHVVAVISKEDAAIAPHVLDLAERGLAGVAKVRSGGWAGKVLLTAVSDGKVFDAYFAATPDKLADIEAVAVPRYNYVPEWASRPTFVATRVVFNPSMLGRADSALLHTLTHEFTHAAMGPVTSGGTPLWLVEGFAEYVAYANEDVSVFFVRESLHRIATAPTALPEDGSFYDSADNYLLGWLACRLIAQKYGPAKLLALYDFFAKDTGLDSGLRVVLGTDTGAYTSAWLAYLKQLSS